MYSLQPEYPTVTCTQNAFLIIRDDLLNFVVNTNTTEILWFLEPTSVQQQYKNRQLQVQMALLQPVFLTS